MRACFGHEKPNGVVIRSTDHGSGCQCSGDPTRNGCAPCDVGAAPIVDPPYGGVCHDRGHGHGHLCSTKDASDRVRSGYGEGAYDALILPLVPSGRNSSCLIGEHDLRAGDLIQVTDVMVREFDRGSRRRGTRSSLGGNRSSAFAEAC